MWGSSWNLPLDEFMSVLDASLRRLPRLGSRLGRDSHSQRIGRSPDKEQLELLGLDPFIAGCPNQSQ